EKNQLALASAAKYQQAHAAETGDEHRQAESISERRGEMGLPGISGERHVPTAEMSADLTKRSREMGRSEQRVGRPCGKRRRRHEGAYCHQPDATRPTI